MTKLHFREAAAPAVLCEYVPSAELEAVWSIVWKGLSDRICVVHTNYAGENFAYFRNKKHHVVSHVPVREALERFSRHEWRDYICSEESYPSSVRDIVFSDVINDLPCTEQQDLDWRMFIGPAGQHAAMHFDGDYRGFILVQLVGRKQYFIVDPSNAWKLFPKLNFSRLRLEAMSEDELRQLALYTNAITGELMPGDAIFVPPAYWHFFHYRTLSVSLSLRLPRQKILVALAEQLPLKTWKTALVAHLLDRGPVEHALVSQVNDMFTSDADYTSAPSAQDIARIEQCCSRILETSTGSCIAEYLVDGLDADEHSLLK